MNNQSNQFNRVAVTEIEDDLLALRKTFSLPTLHYIDISHQKRLTQMMARWPLLNELAQKTGSP